MIKRVWLLLLVFLIMLSASASAEIVRIGKTSCLLLPATEEDLMKRYIFFTGSGDYYTALRNREDFAAADGTLLIPQADSQYKSCSVASDAVMKDLRPQLLSWAQEGSEIILIGYSVGGYPATVLAAYLAQEGYTGRLVLLDGVYSMYRGTHYNAPYFREHLESWKVTICASVSRNVKISVRTAKVGDALSGDTFVDYRQYKMSHNELKALTHIILSGKALPDPEDMEETEEIP